MYSFNVWHLKKKAHTHTKKRETYIKFNSKQRAAEQENFKIQEESVKKKLKRRNVCGKN